VIEERGIMKFRAGFIAVFMLWGGAGAAEEIPAARLKLFRPLPAAMESKSNPLTEAKIELGRMLYYESRISKSHEFSCNSCHLLDKYGVDNEATSPGHKGLRGDRNSPTVYNAAGHFVQFWDGRAADVEEQAKGPVLNPVEMAMPDEATVLATLKSMPEYPEMFKRAFPGEADPVNYDNFAKAVGAFERKLVTPSRWDKFLEGDRNALTAEERAGFNTFFTTGCASCHPGAYLGGTAYHKLGAKKNWPNQKDLGRHQVTKRNQDKMMFKTPSLRNIEKTAPYLHDGSVKTLEETVALMAEYQLGKKLTGAEVASIVTWLNTLTGELPLDYIRKPMLPASTPQTPRPDLTE
jgi:cytochrome c peroxidase